MSKRITQRDRVIAYMKENGSISSLEAIREFGVTRLAAIICNMKKDGYEIGKMNETSRNRYNESVTFARYYFV